MDGSALPLVSENDRRRVCANGRNLADESLMLFPATIPETERLTESSSDGPRGEERDGAAFSALNEGGFFGVDNHPSHLDQGLKITAQT